MSKKADPCGYVAKYVTKQSADLHFGGTLANVNFSEFRKSLKKLGRTDIVQSASLPRVYFHLNNPRRKK
jgi:hypothetical protein